MIESLRIKTDFMVTGLINDTLKVGEVYEKCIKSDGKFDGIYNRDKQAGATGMLVLSHYKV